MGPNTSEKSKSWMAAAAAVDGEGEEEDEGMVSFARLAARRECMVLLRADADTIFGRQSDRREENRERRTRSRKFSEPAVNCF